MKIVLIILFILLLLSPIYPQQEKKENIVEEVTVEWWVVPLFAVDQSGQSILDLKKTDIELTVNTKPVQDFILLKKVFSVSEAPTGTEGEKTPGTPPTYERKKNIFLLFDTALSTKASTEASKAIAQKIIRQAEKNSRFFVMTIEPFGGLMYVGGQTSDKDRVMDIIDQRVKGKANSRVPEPEEVILQVIADRGEKYSAEDIPFLQSSVSKYYKRKTKNFAQAFESLYYTLNSVRDNKFIYLFTEGISSAIQDADKGDHSMYEKYMKDMADYLGKSGSILFVINPFSGAGYDLSESSGKDSLRFLARESGGKYLEGGDEKLLAKVENFHQAYYEIAFPAVPTPPGGVLHISLQPTRQDLEIHSLQVAEKSRDYSQMAPVEREILAINLVTDNPLFKSELVYNNAEIKKISKRKSKVTYQVMLPEQYMNRTLDLYKVWTPQAAADKIDETYLSTGRGIRVEKESLQTRQEALKITFKEVKPGEDTYFALIDGKQKSVLVYGMKKEKPEIYALSSPTQEEWATKETIEKEKIAGKQPGAGIQLDQLLKGTALYCEKLKKAAFHYLCKEKIVESQEPLTYSADIEKDVAVTIPSTDFNVLAKPIVERESAEPTKIRKNQFNYRLIKAGDRVKEERESFQEKEKKGSAAEIDNPSREAQVKEPAAGTVDEILKHIRFVSSKAIFGPLTLLSAERQDKYHFRLLGHQELDKRPTAIVEAYPRDEKDAYFLYGKIWIDTENFSILRIKANPNSILGNERLKKLADELNTRIVLELETEFAKSRDGIRFPTQIHFTERYKGGPFITKYRGSKDWLRTETYTTYYDYVFFNVDMDVVYK